MTPDETTFWAAQLKEAMASENEIAGISAAIQLLVGAALNLALLAHPTGEPL